jgi:hypothetical protein
MIFLLVSSSPSVTVKLFVPVELRYEHVRQIALLLSYAPCLLCTCLTSAQCQFASGKNSICIFTLDYIFFSHSHTDQVSTVLTYFRPRSPFFWNVALHLWKIGDRRFEITYWFHLQGSECPFLHIIGSALLLKYEYKLRKLFLSVKINFGLGDWSSILARYFALAVRPA